MAIIKGAELHFAKLDPKRPSKKFNPTNPTWELQIRTTDKAQKKLWEELNLSVKTIVPDEDGAIPYYRVNLKKKSIKSDKEPASPVEVVDGKRNPIDPNSIGNGSIGNIRIFQYEYVNEGTKKKGIASVMMAVMLTKHIVYKQKAHDDDFDEEETETIDSDDFGDTPDPVF